MKIYTWDKRVESLLRVDKHLLMSNLNTFQHDTYLDLSEQKVSLLNVLCLNE